MSEQRAVPKRALSLEDLVNHDERSASADPNANLKPLPASEVKKRLSVDSSNDGSITKDLDIEQYSGSMHDAFEYNHNGRSNRESDGDDDDDNDDETDTDDELGVGDIVFDTDDFKFDYEKQEKDNLGAGSKKSQETGAEPSDDNGVGRSSRPIDSDRIKQESDVKDIFQEKMSLESKKNNIKKDLKVLNEIAATAKPSRYRVAPQWAQKWKPTVKALQNVDMKDFKIDASFTNIIPDDDLTKSVQDWVYATILSIQPDQRQFIEMEMKFGIIVEGSDTNRVNPPVSSQSVFTDPDAHLTPDIDERVFVELNKFIKGVSELNENTGKFNIIESQTTDSLYRVGISTQRPRFLRMSRDVKTGRIGQFIEKRHVSQLLLYSPKDSYDVKISVNLELPVPDNDPPEKYKDHTPVSSRSKDRISYIHNDSCTRIDITKVENHNQGIKQKTTEHTHEVELEVNTPALLNAFENITQDSKGYASIIRTFLNNGTIVRRKLTTLSFEIFEGQKKV